MNEAGRRFADETTGDEIINQYLAKQEKQRGFLLFKYAMPALCSILMADDGPNL